MSIEQRNYFFQSFIDRFKNGDIPTEETFRNLLDSVAMFRELSDRAQRKKDGLVKTTSDKKVNERDGTDEVGTSPLGIPTFIQPQQLFRIIEGDNVTLTEVVRDGLADEEDETGGGIKDIRIDVADTVIPDIPTDTDDLITAAILSITTLVDPFPYSTINEELAAGATLTDALNFIATYLSQLAVQMDTVADTLYDEMVEKVGEISITVTSPGTWSGKYVEPKGQSLSTATYSDLFGKLGYTYGGAGVSFNLPNLTSESYLRAVLDPSPDVGTITGLDDYSLTVANMPRHNHTFSGTTDNDGVHTHDITVYSDNPGEVVVDGNGGGAITNTTTTEPSGEHSHGFSGTTDDAGSDPVDPIPLTPKAFNVYLKMRILP